MADSTDLSRRGLLAAGAALAAGASRAQTSSPAPPWHGYCLNLGTLRAFGLPIEEELVIAAQAGYRAVEPWVDNVRRWQVGGRSLDELRRRIADLGLAVPSAVGFARWLVDDDTARAKGLEQAKADLELVKAIGGTALAAPPSGATGKPVEVRVAAERYQALLALAEPTGVAAQLEIWGASAALGRLSEALAIAVEAGHPGACVLPDVYHLHRGGSPCAGLRLLSGPAMRVLHVNDYPADPPREKLTDRDRLLPGDGVAPWGEILAALRARGGHTWLSLELFPPRAQGETALDRAKRGLAKLQAVVAQAAG